MAMLAKATKYGYLAVVVPTTAEGGGTNAACLLRVYFTY